MREEKVMLSDNSKFSNQSMLWFEKAGGFRTMSLILSVAVVLMIMLWQPWRPLPHANDQTISVTGTATITATPDEFVFSPTYTFTNADQQVALSMLTAKSDEIVSKLKALSIPSTDIKTNASSSYAYGYYMPIYQGDNNYTLSLTVTVSDPLLAQKVQDYLVTTTPTGAISPSVSFTPAKQQMLQRQARDQAERDAHSQAQQSAQNLGFSIDSVKSVVDNSFDGSPVIYGTSTNTTPSNATKAGAPSLTIEPGQNDLSYSVQVVYYIH